MQIQVHPGLPLFQGFGVMMLGGAFSAVLWLCEWEWLKEEALKRAIVSGCNLKVLFPTAALYRDLMGNRVYSSVIGSPVKTETNSKSMLGIFETPETPTR